ncbi:hypothetical protein [Thalassobaculum sp.]|uniref:hypothetical protein n=1 Tax=Thalassobaculum sp. TaxID=2022740 RepID=UPI003B5AEAAF
MNRSRSLARRNGGTALSVGVGAGVTVLGLLTFAAAMMLSAYLSQALVSAL